MLELYFIVYALLCWFIYAIAYIVFNAVLVNIVSHNYLSSPNPSYLSISPMYNLETKSIVDSVTPSNETEHLRIFSSLHM